MTTPAGAATTAFHLLLNRKHLGHTPAKERKGSKGEPVFDPAPPTPARTFLGAGLADALLFNAVGMERFVADEEAARARGAPLVPPLVTAAAAAAADDPPTVTSSGARIRLIVDRHVPNPIRTVHM